MIKSAKGDLNAALKAGKAGMTNARKLGLLKGDLAAQAAAKVLNAPTPKHMTAAEGSELLLGGSDDDWRTTDPTWQTPTEQERTLAGEYGLVGPRGWWTARLLTTLHRMGRQPRLTTPSSDSASPFWEAFVATLGRSGTVTSPAQHYELWRLGDLARDPAVPLDDREFVTALETVLYNHELNEDRRQGRDLHEVTILPDRNELLTSLDFYHRFFGCTPYLPRLKVAQAFSIHRRFLHVKSK
jgi:hypothetical protein